MYEWRKSLVGFPLKVSFDPVFQMDNLLMFVEISKTPTVGSLVEEIVQRCQLLENVKSELLNTMLEVGDSKLLTSENVCALIDVDVVNIRYMPANASRRESNSIKKRVTASSSTSPSKETAESPDKELDVIPIPTEHNEVSSFQSIDSLSKPSRRPKRRLKYDSIGYALQEMRAKQIKPVDFIQPSVVNKVVESQVNKECDAKNDAAEIGIDVVDDTNEIQLDTDDMSEVPSKKRRKRKRKHSKKKAENEMEVDQTNSNSTPIIAQNPKRRHIYFTDCDDKESCDEDEITYHNISEENSRRDSEVSSCYSTSKSEKSVSDKTIMQSFNYGIEKKRSYPNNGALESNTTVSKPIARSAAAVSAVECERSPITPRNSEDAVDSLVVSNSSISYFLPLQKRERKDDKNIATDLATLLMPKELKTHCEYDVQFVNHTKNCVDAAKKAQSCVNGNDAVRSRSFERNSKPETRNIHEPSPKAYSWRNVKFEPRKDVEKLSLTSPRTDALGNRQEGNSADRNGLDGKKCEETTNDCQFLKQFKLEGNVIRMEKYSGVWLTLTPEIAATELPDVDVFKDNQSIVFQAMYLNKEFCPTVSGLICAKVLSYKSETENVILDIPAAFMKTLFDDCPENFPPTEEFHHLVGDAYEVPRYSLKNVKLLG